MYFVLEGDSDTNSRVLYVGQAINLAWRWKNHNRWKQLKSISNNLRIAWLECGKGKAVLSIIETAFIQSLEPELNESKDSVCIWITLPLIGWDYRAAEKTRWILGKIDKTKQEKKIFVAILQELLSETAKPLAMSVPENWRPSRKDVVLWVDDGKELPCTVISIVEEKSEAQIYLSTLRETTKMAKENGLTKSRYGGSVLYVPLSELKPAQGLGLKIVEMIASGECRW